MHKKDFDIISGVLCCPNKHPPSQMVHRNQTLPHGFSGHRSSARRRRRLYRFYVFNASQKVFSAKQEHLRLIKRTSYLVPRNWNKD